MNYKNFTDINQIPFFIADTISKYDIIPLRSKKECLNNKNTKTTFLK